ncbi:glycosyltransferase [Salininema proteolyticum]|uniref:Glycosyltransferase n=1 Tax=Salininema proteolyticum TaxID=1607685 RepID=A0ABV8TSR7_9ACTN
MSRNDVKRSLPREPIYGLTWTIPDNFGGLTSVLLHRSSTFARLGRRRVDILTLAYGLDVRARERELRETGRLAKKARLRNLWKELANLSDRKLAKGFAANDHTFDEPTDLLSYEGAGTTKRLAADGTVLQIDYFRRNGTRLVSDRRDVKKRGTVGGRRLTLFSRKGAVLNQWTRATGLYFAWFDHVMGTGPAYLINDSQFVGGFLHNYRRPDVTTVQVLHNSHLDHGAEDSFGRLAGHMVKTVKGLGSYDLVAPLTARQAGELDEARLAGGNMIPIPNSRTLDERPDVGERDRNDGIMVARLTYQKRIEHAVEAFAKVRADGGEARVRIFGDGRLRENVERQIEELDATPYVTLMGHRTDVKEHFHRASFSVLSSRFEGLPLVLVEGMGAGCIPIAYDVRYGAGDIITHGVDGFLVPAGDVDALAATIAEVSTLPEDRLRELRRNARERAADFSDEAVTREWGAALAEARDRKRALKSPKGKAVLDNLRAKQSELVFEGRIADGAELNGATVYLSWSARGLPVYGRIPATVREEAGSGLAFEARWPVERSRPVGSGVLDFDVEVEVPGGFARMRLCASEMLDAEAVENLEPYVTVKGNVSVKAL